MAALATLRAGAGEQPVFEHVVGEIGWQRPRQPGRLGPLEIVVDRAARDTEHPPDFARADAFADQPQYLWYPPHVLFAHDHEALTPELLTQGKTRKPVSQVADD